MLYALLFIRICLQFEEMLDRLEKSSGQSVVTLPDAKSLLKEDDDLIIAVYDYWLEKRLKTVIYTWGPSNQVVLCTFFLTPFVPKFSNGLLSPL